MKRSLLAMILVSGACAPKPDPTLTLTLAPKTVTNATPVQVQVAAVKGDGSLGTGLVKLTSGAGSLSTPVEVQLDSYGTARAELICDPRSETDCVRDVTVTAKWTIDGVTATAEARLNAGGVTAAGGGAGGGGAGVTGGGGGGCDGSVLNGVWQRSDGFEFTLSAAGCTITGVGDNTQFHHRFVAQYNPVSQSMPVSINRTVLATSCVTVMTSSLTLVDATHFNLTVTGTDGLCDLAMNFTETQGYVKR